MRSLCSYWKVDAHLDAGCGPMNVECCRTFSIVQMMLNSALNPVGRRLRTRTGPSAEQAFNGRLGLPPCVGPSHTAGADKHDAPVGTQILPTHRLPWHVPPQWSNRSSGSAPQRFPGSMPGRVPVGAATVLLYFGPVLGKIVAHRSCRADCARQVPQKRESKTRFRRAGSTTP